MKHTGTRKRFRRPATSAPSISSDQEVSASVNRFKVTRNRISNKNKKNEIQTGKSEDYKVGMLIVVTYTNGTKEFYAKNPDSCSSAYTICVFVRKIRHSSIDKYLPSETIVMQFRFVQLVCYYTNWSQYRTKIGKFLPEDIQPDLCTHIIFAFGWLKKNKLTSFESNDETKDGKIGLYERVVNLKKANPSLKILLAIGE